MRVYEKSIYRGPNLYSLLPMLRIQVDLGDLENWPTNRIDGFSERLQQLLPGLQQHGCCYEVPGGFLRRLVDGTWLGHVVEHVAIELQSCVGLNVTRGKTRSVRGRPGVYNVMYEYRDETVGLLAGRLALELVDSLLPADKRGLFGLHVLDVDYEPPASDFNLGHALDALGRLQRRVAFGPTTQALVDEAERRGIPVMRLDEHSFVQLGYGHRQRRVRASITSLSGYLAVETASDKDLTKRLLAEAGVPTPKGEVVRREESAVSAANRLGYPVVVKPLDGNHGRAVGINLKTDEHVRAAFRKAVDVSRRVIVEQYFRGRDYRILVVDGDVVAVSERVPAHVVGDGQRTIRELVAEVNKDPRRGVGHECVMTRIEIDEDVVALLASTGRTPETVPPFGERVYLRSVANMSQGGTAIDRTGDIHPHNRLIASRAALVLGLDVAGVDFIAPDIRDPAVDCGGVVEVNASPGLRMHLQPSEGRGRDVARPIIRMLFPGQASRIPIFAVTGTNGKSTTTRMLAHILRQTGRRVGYTMTTGVYVDDERIGEWDASGPKSARMILRDPTVEAAVFETARGGILREGLAFDRCDVGAVLNVQADHIGLRGVETLEDLASVKSVVVEAVHRRGHSILNADDPLTVGMAPYAGGRVVYFSMQDAWPDHLAEHIAGGGIAVVRERKANGDRLVIHRGRGSVDLMGASEIPATLNGLAEFNVENALAAAAMAYAWGLTPGAIRMALRSFTSSFEQCPGRLNVYDGHPFRVILDYAHNPAGLRALGSLVKALRGTYGRCIGMVNIPGDRRDDDMREMGRIAADIFDEIVFREDPARRGRKPGEIVGLLAEGALAVGFPKDRIRKVLDECEAAQVCLQAANPGDLVVLTPTEVEDMWREVISFRPLSDSPERRRHGLRGAA